jgi:hypothetical protein
MAIIASALARIKSDPPAILGGASAINEHFLQHGHVWRERHFDPATTLKLFIHQILAGNVAIAALRHLVGWDFAASSYCEARQRLGLIALAGLVERASCDCIQSIQSCLPQQTRTFLGRRVQVADATTTCLPDTPALQKLWPQPAAQKPGCGFPIIKLLGLLDLATGMILHMTLMCLSCHEMSQLAGLHGRLCAGDVLLADRGLCSFSHLFLLGKMQVDAVFRMHQRQVVDFTPGRGSRGKSSKRYKRGVPSSHFVRKLGTEDQIVEWIKPAKQPEWMSAEQFDALPVTLLVRELAYQIVEHGRRTRRVIIATTLLDAVRYPKHEIAKLYGLRWEIETNFRHLKQTMKMEQLKCQTPDGIVKELMIYLLVYNLVRSVMALAAARQNAPIQRISFIDAVRWLGSGGKDGWMPLLVVNPVRCGRWCPRVKKRRMKEYDLMVRPRHTYQQPPADEGVTN